MIKEKIRREEVIFGKNDVRMHDSSKASDDNARNISGDADANSKNGTCSSVSMSTYEGENDNNSLEHGTISRT